MKHTVAIEPALTPIKDYLTNKGYNVESISLSNGANTSAGKSGNFDAYIVTGMNTNLMGIHDTSTKAVVIDADGLTPEQVYKELQTRLD
ncbi:MAG: YkuS family protein [Bacillota bacterium]|nr:YkuS family protein [Bacillota bacterium]